MNPFATWIGYHVARLEKSAAGPIMRPVPRPVPQIMVANRPRPGLLSNRPAMETSRISPLPTKQLFGSPVLSGRQMELERLGNLQESRIPGAKLQPALLRNTAEMPPSLLEAATRYIRRRSSGGEPAYNKDVRAAVMKPSPRQEQSGGRQQTQDLQKELTRIESYAPAPWKAITDANMFSSRELSPERLSRDRRAMLVEQLQRFPNSLNYSLETPANIGKYNWPERQAVRHEILGNKRRSRLFNTLADYSVSPYTLPAMAAGTGAGIGAGYGLGQD